MQSRMAPPSTQHWPGGGAVGILSRRSSLTPGTPAGLKDDGSALGVGGQASQVVGVIRTKRKNKHTPALNKFSHMYPRLVKNTTIVTLGDQPSSQVHPRTPCLSPTQASVHRDEAPAGSGALVPTRARACARSNVKEKDKHDDRPGPCWAAPACPSETLEPLPVCLGTGAHGHRPKPSPKDTVTDMFDGAGWRHRRRGRDGGVRFIFAGEGE